MKIIPTLSDQAILTELGARLTRLRLDRNLTQAEVAKQAGVAKRTVERIESGGGAQLANIIRICRVLDIVASLDQLIPVPTASPLAMLALEGGKRKRASGGFLTTKKYPDYQQPQPTNAPIARQWRWGEDDKPDNNLNNDGSNKPTSRS
jgi:transcriptional regulator with XRE-family HTH domain